MKRLRVVHSIVLALLLGAIAALGIALHACNEARVRAKRCLDDMVILHGASAVTAAGLIRKGETLRARDYLENDVASTLVGMHKHLRMHPGFDKWSWKLAFHLKTNEVTVPEDVRTIITERTAQEPSSEYYLYRADWPKW